MFLITFNRIKREKETGEIAERLTREVFELNIVASEYFAYQEERTLQQWWHKYTSIEDDLVEILDEKQTTTERSTVEAIINNYKSMSDLFRMLESSFAKRKDLIEKDKFQTTIVRLRSLGEMLTTQLLLKSQMVARVSNKLSVSNQINREKETGKIADDITKNILDMNIIASEYFMHHDERMQQQWWRKYKTTNNKLEKVFEEKLILIDQGKIEAIINDFKSMGDLFKMLESNFAKRKGLIEENKFQATIERFLSLEERLRAQLLLKSQMVTGECIKLSMLAKRRITQSEQMAVWIVLIFTIIFVLVVCTVSFFTITSITKPIKSLSAGAEIIGKGNLEYKIKLETKNEMLQLAGYFNKMVESLRENRDNLEALIDERTRELRNSQDKLISSERLAVLGKLSSGIAHEIRNPLATIGSSAYYLKRKLKDADETTISNVDRIMGQVEESTAIIQGLQDLAKMEAPQKSRKDIANVIGDSLNTLKTPRDVQIVMDVPEGEFFVDVDEKQILMMFNNILNNAVQAMDNKGTIRINADRNSDNCVEISIEDSGYGIKAENLEEIFQPFFGTKAKGFGFGLSICQMIVEKHGGEIEARSEEGKGATFIVRLPSAGVG